MPARRKTFAVPEALLGPFMREHPGVDPDAHRVLFALRAVAQFVNDRANEWLAPLELTVGKYNYLVALGTARRGGLTLTEIARLIHTKSATVTQMIAALERDGLVARAGNPGDRRSTVARLTPAGKALLRKAVEHHHAHIERAMREFGASDRRALFASLLRLGASFSVAEPAVAARRGRLTRANRGRYHSTAKN